MKILSEWSKKTKEQKKNKGSVLVAESAYNAQFGLVMKMLLVERNCKQLMGLIWEIIGSSNVLAGLDSFLIDIVLRPLD